MSDNNFRIVGLGTTYLSPTDFLIQVDTSAGAVTLILPKITTILASYTTIFQYMGIRVVDISDNASVNNITIQGFETNVINASSSVVLNTNGAGGIFTLIGNNEWSFQQNSTGGGGANTPIDITYAQLYNKIQNSELIAGQNYRLTDYQSTNILNGNINAGKYLNNNATPTDPNYNPLELYTSPTIENLVFQAISSNEINPQVVSEEFPSDVILYQPIFNTIVSKINIYNGAVLNLNSGTLNVSGFDLQFDGTNCYIILPTETPIVFGYSFSVYMNFNPKDSLKAIFYNSQPNIILTPNEFDGTIFSDIEISSDGLTITFLNLTATDYANYVADSLITDYSYVIGNQKGLITSRKYIVTNDFTNPIVDIDCDFDWRSQKYRRFEIDLSAINPNLGLGYYGIGDNPSILGLSYPTTGNYLDFFTINNDGFCFNIVIKGNYLLYADNNIFTGATQNVTLIGCSNNTFSYANNVCFNFSVFNIINSIEHITNELVYFNENVVQNVARCEIGSSFYNNNVLNEISDSVIGHNCNENTFNGLSDVSLPVNTTKNVFNVNLVDCIITIDCSSNIIQSGSKFANNNFSILKNNSLKNPINWYNNYGFGNIDNIDIDDMSNNNITGTLISVSGSGSGSAFNNNIVNSILDTIVFTIISSNQFYADLTNITFISLTQKNIFQAKLSGVNVSLATHIYGNYLCTIFLGSDGNTYLEYFDGTNMLYVSPIS